MLHLVLESAMQIKSIIHYYISGFMAKTNTGDHTLPLQGQGVEIVSGSFGEQRIFAFVINELK